MKWILSGVLVLGLFIAWLINMDYLFSNQPPSSGEGKMTLLQTTINKCTNVAEQAAAHLPEALPFQRLEKIGRQARVMRLCMGDNGFEQSDAWTSYAQPVANANAHAEGISVNEAFENLRRQHMTLLSPLAGAPSYWISKK